MVASIVGAGISALGSIGGALANNAISSHQMQELAEYQAKLNYKYNKKYAQWSALNTPSFNREGIENAGYNPMLALGGLTQGSNATSWSQYSNPNNSDLSSIGSDAVSTALAIQNQQNQNKLTEAQEVNYNADSVLKNNQAITEMYTQLEKLNHADLEQAQATLTRKNVSWFDRIQAREDLRVANELERTANDFKVGMAQAIAGQIQASASSVSANANAYDIYSNKASQIQQQKEYNEWAKKHPYLKSFDQTLTRYLSPSAGAAGGYVAGKHAPTVTNLKKPLGFK